MIIPVAMVGCGNWGPKLLRHFAASPRFRVVAAVETRAARRRAVRAEHPALHVSADFADALAPEVRLVVLATPPSTHHALGLRALEAGKHVLVEKPMAMSSAQCRELNDLARDKGLKVLVDHTALFHPAVAFIRECLDKGELGQVRHFDAARLNGEAGASRPDETEMARAGSDGAEVLWDLAPHDFSVVDYLFPEEPASVSARSAQAADETVDATFTYPSGMVCRFRFRHRAPAKVRRTELNGTRKRLLFDESEAQAQVRVFAGASDVYVPELSGPAPLGNLVDHVWSVLAQGAPTRIAGSDGARIVGLMEAAEASLRSGRPVAVGWA